MVVLIEQLKYSMLIYMISAVLSSKWGGKYNDLQRINKSTDFIDCEIHYLHHIAGICIKVNSRIWTPRSLLFSMDKFQTILLRYNYHAIEFLHSKCTVQ